MQKTRNRPLDFRDLQRHLPKLSIFATVFDTF